MSSPTSVAVLGGSGLVGSRVLELWADKFELIAPTHAQLDVLDCDALAAFVAETRANVILNLAAWADVDGAEPQRGNRNGGVWGLNAEYPARLANLCGEHKKHLVHVSTDYVFDGASLDRPYREADPTGPLGWYAETKLGGEQGVLSAGAQACVARIEMPFSAREHPKQDLARLALVRLRRGEPMVGVVDQRITPVFLDDAAQALRLLVEARFTGIVHVAASDWTTPYRFIGSIARRLGLPADVVHSEAFADFATRRPARRPQHPWLDVSRFADLFGSDILRSPEAALDAWFAQMVGIGATSSIRLS